jgi:hypothetical protein
MTDDPRKQANPEPPESSWPERHVSWIITALVVACAATLAAEPVWRPFFDEHHPAHFPIENVIGYQALLGFVAFVCVVFLGKLLRVFVKRPEDYYDR